MYYVIHGNLCSKLRTIINRIVKWKCLINSFLTFCAFKIRHAMTKCFMDTLLMIAISSRSPHAEFFRQHIYETTPLFTPILSFNLTITLSLAAVTEPSWGYIKLLNE